MYKLTIVIPAYNAAQYIGKTLDSIAPQVKDGSVEVIVVNDGSTDNTSQVVERYRERFPFITCIITTNRGPAFARNTGLEMAKGSHVWYVDSDDTLKSGAIGKVLKSIDKEKHPDIIIFGFDIVGPASEPIRYLHRFGPFTTKSKRELSPHLAILYEDNMLNQVWNKIFSVELLRKHNVRFQDYRYGEDRLFVFDAISVAQKIKMAGESLYEYSIARRESLISKFYEDKFKVSLLIHERAQKLAHDCGAVTSEAAEIFDYMFLKTVTSCMTNMYSPSCTYTFRQKYDFVNDILANPAVKAAAKRKYNRPIFFKLLAKNIRSGVVLTNLASAYFITITSKSAPRLFIRAKHNR